MEDGDICWNPFFGDLWIVDGSDFVKINDGYRAEIEEVVGFVKVGHADVSTKKERRLKETLIENLCIDKLLKE